MTDGVAADYAAAVASPEERASGAIGGHIGSVGADVGDAQRHEGFLGVINAVGSQAVGSTDRDVQAVAVRADELGAGGAGQINLGSLDEGAGFGVKLVKVEGLVVAGGNGH